MSRRLATTSSRSSRSLRALRLPLAATAATVLALGPATAAWGHIHTDPEAVEAGTENTVAFLVEHGCDGSPTTKLEIQLPDGATGIAGVDSSGFTSTVDGQVVTFEGGELDPETALGFAVTFTAPEEAGVVPVKIVQTCEVGSIDWIEETVEGEEEPERPAPLLTITEGAPTGEEGHHGEEGGEEGHEEGEATETTVATGEEAATTEEAGEEVEAENEENNTNTLIAGGVIGVLVIAGGAFLAKRKAASSDAGDGA